jgi:hypothetical protein
VDGLGIARRLPDDYIVCGARTSNDVPLALASTDPGDSEMTQNIELAVLKESDLDALFPGARAAGYTKVELAAAALMIDAVAEAIKGLGSVPSGHLYAMLTGMMTLEMYLAIIAKLQRLGMISNSGHLLTWIQS